MFLLASAALAAVPDAIPRVGIRQIMEFSYTDALRVVLFANASASLEFANFSIAHHGGAIRFFAAAEALGARFRCASFPCAVAFRGGLVVADAPPPEPTAPAFLLWCDRLLDAPSIPVTSSDHLAVLLAAPAEIALGVDGAERPPGLPAGRLFYAVASELLAAAGISARAGVYRYGPPEAGLAEYEPAAPANRGAAPEGDGL
jgi:hypothetical protein